MGDGGGNGENAEKSLDELKKELDEVEEEIQAAEREFEAEHPKGPKFIDGESEGGGESIAP